MTVYELSNKSLTCRRSDLKDRLSPCQERWLKRRKSPLPETHPVHEQEKLGSESERS